MRVVAAMVVAWLGNACIRAGTYPCAAHEECGGDGTCASGYCAFPDPSCLASGVRWGSYAPNGLAGSCVPRQDPETAPDGSPGGDGQGWATDGEPFPDAADRPPDAVEGPRCEDVCPAPASCDPTGTCVFRCAGANSCAAGIVCPSEVPCRVECGGGYSCGGGVQCSGPGCTILCTGFHSCGGPIGCAGDSCDVICGNDACGAIDCTAATCDITCRPEESCGWVTCGPGRCTIACEGGAACTRVDCRAACACDLSCGPGDCEGLSCAHDCRSSFSSCTSAGPGCDTCP